MWEGGEGERGNKQKFFSIVFLLHRSGFSDFGGGLWRGIGLLFVRWFAYGMGFISLVENSVLHA